MTKKIMTYAYKKVEQSTSPKCKKFAALKVNGALVNQTGLLISDDSRSTTVSIELPTSYLLFNYCFTRKLL